MTRGRPQAGAGKLVWGQRAMEGGGYGGVAEMSAEIAKKSVRAEAGA